MKKIMLCCLLCVGFGAVYGQADTIKAHIVEKTDSTIYYKDYYKINDFTIVIHTITDLKGAFIQRFKMVHRGEYNHNHSRYTYDVAGRVKIYEKYGGRCNTINYRIVYDDNGCEIFSGRVGGFVCCKG